MSEEKPTDQDILDASWRGRDASSGKAYVEKYIWMRLWRAVTALANCPPDLPTLLEHRSEIRAHMRMAQEMNLDIQNADAAVKRLRAMYEKQDTGG